MNQNILNKCRKVVKYYRENGGKKFLRHLLAKIFRFDEMSYKRWRKKNVLSYDQLQKEKDTKFVINPLFSIVVPLFCTPPEYLRDLVESIMAQTYSQWELCLSDGSGEGKSNINCIKSFLNDPRVKVISSNEPLDISSNTNCALSIARGDYIAFVDHDDLLEPDALYECVRLINLYPEAEIIYTDEDKVSADGKQYFQPHFKSDFNLDLLRSMNYICHLLVLRSDVQKKVGAFQKEFNGAQDYDFILRSIEQCSNIYHIPKVLYHWRTHENSTSENPSSKMYAFEAGKHAIESHLNRVGLKATVTMGEYPGLYRVKYHISKEPLVSIIIPNKDHKEDLKRCIESLLNKPGYKNIEILVAENNSKSQEIFDYYNELTETYENIRVLSWTQGAGFNYSALNNFAAQHSKGEYLLFLNNDTEVINEGCIREMVSLAVRSDVGAVGARLYYPDGKIQHAGVILGLGGVAGHAFKDFAHNANGYFSRIICIQDYSAVTAACMMISKELFKKIGGFDEKLKVAFNDIDLCMKIREQGLLIVYTPYAELYHYESKSRGQEDTKEKIDRFNEEVSYFCNRWNEKLEEGDIYYNPNLTLDKHDFSLKIV
ncbi:glycosyltransferase family 2 protein [Lachnoclostridium sp. An118]|uniref:glycosyltransferase family 2 protein n=1 Tax=Lachnoclostridium sp. An118 TaxID=1965547 RepID=UPI000B393B4A|nr:glycosyltransferase family 2 protein [Lachnoclostridium sp. An118]OUQ46184.1 hypothetical protein B5E62_16230 [Lachnoclostridium sp. An118]